jgi:hypothetical protein
MGCLTRVLIDEHRVIQSLSHVGCLRAHVFFLSLSSYVDFWSMNYLKYLTYSATDRTIILFMLINLMNS